MAQTEAAEVQVTLKDERIFQARRVGCRDALIGGGVSPDQAERWCAIWEAEAARYGVARGPYYWDAGRGWIDAERASRKSLPLRSALPS